MMKCCGNCKYHHGYMVEKEKVWYCDNEISENNDCETKYYDTCDDWEEDE